VTDADAKTNLTQPSIDSVIEAKQIDYVAAYTKVDIFALPIWAAVVFWCVSDLVPEFGPIPIENRISWFGIILAWSISATAVHYMYARRNPGPETCKFWSGTFSGLYFFNGLAWGSSAWLLWIDGSMANNLMIIIIAIAASTTYVFQYTPHFKIFLSAFIPLQIPFMLRYLTDDTSIGTAFNFLGPAFVIWIIFYGRETYKKLTNALKTQIENEELADRLRSMHDGLEAQVAVRTKQLERELRWREETQAELQSAKEQAEAANTAKSQFLSSMSHELRTPLNAVLGFGQLLEADPTVSDDPSRKTSVEQILKGGHHLLALINEVLDLSKIESDSLTLSVEVVDPVMAMRDCLSLVVTAAGENKITLVNRSAGHTLPPILADYTRLKQMLINLLSNAIKYSGEGSTVTLNALETDKGTVRFLVSDNGPGIPAGQQCKIFEPFNRLGAQNSDIEGTGIGLTITKRLAEAMDGSIGFESETDQGTTFWIELPIANKSASTLAKTPDPQLIKNGTTSDMGNRTVLYVEDNPSNLELMQRIIDEVPGMALVTARDAETALQLFNGGAPDMVIMDIHLPGMDGFGALHKLRQSPATMNIPIIALSASAMPRDIERGLKAGFNKYLTKPIVIEEFLGAVKELFVS